MPRKTTAAQDFRRGIWRENPVFIQMLGLCPALAVSNTVLNSLAMGLATFFVLFCSSVLVATFKKLIPAEVRISTYILIIATFVTVADMTLEAVVPEIHKALGAFIALIVVNCIILGRQEAFASKNTVPRAMIDAVGTGIGFIIAMLMMGTIREILGYGTFLGFPLFGGNYEPWIIFILPPGGFFTIGFILLGLNWWERRKLERARSGEPPAGVAVGRAA
jgi:electron transport complex protein RnfE